MSIKGKLRLIIKHLRGHADPVKNCIVWIEQGCSHVDGMLCNFPHCSTFKKYYKEKINGEHFGACVDCKHNYSCCSNLYGQGCDTHYENDKFDTIV